MRCPPAWTPVYRLLPGLDRPAGCNRPRPSRAQREAVRRHVTAAAGVIVAKFTEVESGKRNDRPQKSRPHWRLAEAQNATLVIAKLDRLARKVHFARGLMESGVDFVVCDNPHANR